MDKIATKIVTAELSGWHIVTGLSKFTDHCVILKNHHIGQKQQ